MYDNFNLDLAVKVLAQIERTSAAHDQQTWGRGSRSEILDAIVDAASGELIGYGTCGTAQCYAGWALTITDTPMRWLPGLSSEWRAYTAADGTEVSATAMRLLGLDANELCPEWTEEDDCERENCAWSHGAGYPQMFETYLTLDDLYEWVSRFSRLSVEEVRNRAMALAYSAERILPERQSPRA